MENYIQRRHTLSSSKLSFWQLGMHCSWSGIFCLALLKGVWHRELVSWSHDHSVIFDFKWTKSLTLFELAKCQKLISPLCCSIFSLILKKKKVAPFELSTHFSAQNWVLTIRDVRGFEEYICELEISGGFGMIASCLA